MAALMNYYDRLCELLKTAQGNMGVEDVTEPVGGVGGSGGHSRPKQKLESMAGSVAPPPPKRRVRK
ncbi:hypothetical protein PM082_014227 [Marasmius tenuissimus]|nr:hypothetical protein PM082_014227 [Marasmius tenuissimus]